MRWSPSGIRPLVLAAAFLPSCSAVAWEEPGGAVQDWRGYEMRQADRAFVLARSRSTAEESYRQIDEMVQAAERIRGVRIPRGLVIAVGRNDPPLLPGDDPFPEMMRLHLRSVGAKPRHDRPRERGEVDFQLMAKSIPFGVPRDDRSLALPGAILDQAAWILVLPTKSCIREVMGDVMSQQMAKKLSLWKRILIAPFMPLARGAAANLMRAETMGAAYEVLFTPIELSPAERRQLTQECLVELGISKKQVIQAIRDDPRIRELEKKHQEESGHPHSHDPGSDSHRQGSRR